MLSSLQELIKESAKRKYSAGSTILFQGEIPRSACILVSGIVRVFSISKQGDEQIVMYHIAGEFFPSSWIFGKSTSNLFYYEAVTACEVALCTRTRLIDYMLADNVRMHALLDYFTTNFAALLIRVNSLEQSRARDKLIYTLYYLCYRYSKNNNLTVTIPLQLTHQNIASLVGLTRETTAIEMSKLKKENVLSYKGKIYTINVPKLLKLLGEDSFSEQYIMSSAN